MKPGIKARKERWSEQTLPREIKRYTVLLAYPEGYADFPGESYMAWVVARSPSDAVDHARKQCIEANESGEFGDPPGSDLEPIAVYKGWLEDVKP